MKKKKLVFLIIAGVLLVAAAVTVAVLFATGSLNGSSLGISNADAFKR